MILVLIRCLQEKQVEPLDFLYLEELIQILSLLLSLNQNSRPSGELCWRLVSTSNLFPTSMILCNENDPIRNQDMHKIPSHTITHSCDNSHGD